MPDDTGPNTLAALRDGTRTQRFAVQAGAFGIVLVLFSSLVMGLGYMHVNDVAAARKQTEEDRKERAADQKERLAHLEFLKTEQLQNAQALRQLKNLVATVGQLAEELRIQRMEIRRPEAENRSGPKKDK